MAFEPGSVELEEEPVPLIVLRGVEKEAARIASSLNVSRVIAERERIRTMLYSLGLLGEVNSYSGRSPCVLAIDTSFTSPPLELVGGRLLLIVRSYVIQGCKCLKELQSSSSEGFIRFSDAAEYIAPIYSKIYERKFVKEVLELKKAGEAQVDLVLIDGELFPRTPPGFESNAKSSVMKLYAKLVDLTQEVLELACETDTAIVGIVKRSYGRDVAVRLLDPQIRVNDKALASYILKPGEFVDLGSYGDIAFYLWRFMDAFKEYLSYIDLRTYSERLSWILGVIESCSSCSSIGLSIYRARVPTYFMVSTKIEYWVNSEFNYNKLLSYLSSVTGMNGVPHQLDVVDSMSMISRNTLYLVQQQLFKELSRITGDVEIAMSIAGLTNPEKIKVIGLK
ncbi:MAG: DNA double-strand break repair nuclease NurA [Desulfurococcaceae archaeon]